MTSAADQFDVGVAVLPWHHPATSSAPWAPAQPPLAPSAPAVVPVAWAARTSDEEAQDPTLSLPRQLARARAALPPGFVIVAHFFDVESGRMELAQRGQGAAFAQFDIPIPRDGGINDLLAEAHRADRRFVAVVCESIDRISRITRIGTTIEWELEQAGVALLAVDEGIRPELVAELGGGETGRPKKATPILTRRVKQAISEWYVLNMLELSWEGFVQHTIQGWNVGKPPYGYLAEKLPHPVPARRAEGRTKHRLVPDPSRGPVITRIYQLRGVDRLGYDTIADRLNADLDLNPPPQPVDPQRAVGRWTGSAVREILSNPKYTGYMVWNRRRNPRRGRRTGKVNTPAQWTWSPIPTHEPLVTRELFDAASPVARDRQGSRTGAEPNIHPQTKRTYLLRSYLTHDLCGRRMGGKGRARGGTYYTCELNPRHDAGKAWYTEHPNSVWVREDALTAAVHHFFATRILGPHRRDYINTQLNADRSGPDEDITRRRAHAQQHLDGLRRRQTKILDQLDSDEDDDLDPETRREFRQRLRARFAEITTDIRKAEADHASLAATPATQPTANTDLLDHLPQVELHLPDVPADLQRRLYDAFDLKILYNQERHEATLQATITADALDNLTQNVERATPTTIQVSPSRPATTADEPQRPVSHVLCAPNPTQYEPSTHRPGFRGDRRDPGCPTAGAAAPVRRYRSGP